MSDVTGGATEPAATTAPTQAPLHSFYCDPENKTVLVSADGVQFRVSAFRLAQVSELFRADETRDNAIALLNKYDSDVIEIYLDICQERPVDSQSALRPPNVRPLITLLVETGSWSTRDELFEFVETRSMLPGDLAWSLAYASRLQDETWAATCIWKLARSLGLEAVQRAEHVRYILKQCSQKWQTVLFDILLTDDHPGGSRALIRQDWAVIASEFKARIQEARANSYLEDQERDQEDQPAGTDERGKDAERTAQAWGGADGTLEKDVRTEVAGDLHTQLERRFAGAYEGQLEGEEASERRSGYYSDDSSDMSPDEALRMGKRSADENEPLTAQRPRKVIGI